MSSMRSPQHGPRSGRGTGAARDLPHHWPTRDRAATETATAAGKGSAFEVTRQRAEALQRASAVQGDEAMADTNVRLGAAGSERAGLTVRIRLPPAERRTNSGITITAGFKAHLSKICA